MAVVAESHVVCLVLHEQIGLGRRMGLMAGETTERSFNFALVGWIQYVGDGMTLHRVSKAKAQGQNRHLVLLVVVVGQLDLAIEDGEEMFSVNRLRRRVGTVALQAKRIALGAKEMIDIAAVRRMASGTALHKSRLVMHRLLAQIVDVGVAAEADADGVSLRQARLVAGVRTVAVSAIAHCAGVGHFG